MAQLNLRGIPDDLYDRLRVAAANGGARTEKGALQRFVIRALQRSLNDLQPGGGLPKLKLVCEVLLSQNLQLVNRTMTGIVLPSSYDATPRQLDVAPRANGERYRHLFDDLLSQEMETGDNLFFRICDPPPDPTGVETSEVKWGGTSRYL